ncbi:hypothetical protein GCM10025868_30460 [Angustibacter aerolatus]|uniref:Pyrroline-5-carboxylate reductase catalytic N-terminal domain-containing protein n=1 Tax=Angustibacter aerolatus TaxID=1162965 RepID=A0ABQ6JJR1_9ACTN|nr:hypothetical protein GCM10025868_30460 [Angustibacter aerolatus]
MRVVDNAEAAAAARTVVLVVKPQDMTAALAEIRDHLTPGTLVVSLAAGITTASIEAALPEGTPVVRVMPNTPALVDEGMAAVSPGAHCDDDHLEAAEEPAALVRAGAAPARAPPRRRHRDQRFRSGVHLLRRRGDDRGRRAAGPAALDVHRARRADAVRRGHHAARDR